MIWLAPSLSTIMKIWLAVIQVNTIISTENADRSVIPLTKELTSKSFFWSTGFARLIQHLSKTLVESALHTVRNRNVSELKKLR